MNVRSERSLTASEGLHHEALTGLGLDASTGLRLEGGEVRDLERMASLEWLETNGLGGWAASTVAGAHSRRYHGLLVAATRPPVERTVLLSKLDETILSGDHVFELGCNHFGTALHPRGHQYLESFERGLFPCWTFAAGGVRLERTIAALDGENTILVAWEVLEAPGPIVLELRPFVAGRNFHALSSHGARPWREAVWEGDALRLRATDVFEGQLHEFYLGAPGASFAPAPDWWQNFTFAIEAERGFDAREDLWTPGVQRMLLRRGERFAVVVSTVHPRGRDATALLEHETRRRLALVGKVPAPIGAVHATVAAVPVPPPSVSGPDRSFASAAVRSLLLAADQFIVRRGSGLRTVIAGYHWFGDWGRDTMIALPGLCLATGRFEEARSILRAFAASTDRGMLPNRFPDRGEAPEYNTVDATLWFFVALHKYLQATGDAALVRDEMLPVLRDIFSWHERGTRYGIGVDEDGLLHAGEPGVQLTWMDAKVGDYVVTPRHGKPVEVNALWINALWILAELERRFGTEDAGAALRARATRLASRFEALYWNESAGCLFDVVPAEKRDWAGAATQPATPDASIRPNQIFAASLPYALLSPEKALRVLEVVEAELLTPVGLRSLSRAHPLYRPRYEGDVWARDTAYHQGTVWSWLLGPFITALVRYRGAAGREQGWKLWQGAQAHRRNGLVGSVAEIFDAEPPHAPRGAAAQAWGVAELLRAHDEDLVPHEMNAHGHETSQRR